MPTRLRSARSHSLRSALLARQAAQMAGQLIGSRRGRFPIGDLAALVTSRQAAAAVAAEAGVAAMLAEQGLDVASAGRLNPLAFTTTASSLDAMTGAIADRRDLRFAVVGADHALSQVQFDAEFRRLVASLVQDAGRAAEGVATAARPRTQFVRLVTPPCCSRCAILAGRVYRYSQGFLRHPNCDCVMVPTVEGAGMAQNPHDLFERGLVTGLSKADLEAIAQGADLNQVVNIRRIAGDMHQPGRVLARRGRLTPEGIYAAAGDDRDAALELLRSSGYILGRPATRSPGSAAGGVGGGPPTPPRSGAAAAPDPDDWAARQAALGIAASERLEHHEIVFLERFTGLGHEVDWIPRHVYLPTNDLIWVNNGRIRVEVKSTKARFDTIRRAIERSVVKAGAHGVVKENFIIDLGSAVLTAGLRNELRDYNDGRARSRISRLWVLSEDGRRLEEIQLRT